MTIRLDTTEFEQGAPIPVNFTGDGLDISPPLIWSEPPIGTKSFALICDDPDAPRQTYVHWVMFNIPADIRELPKGVSGKNHLPIGAIRGTNDFGHLDYGGPLPPPGKPHRYFFKLYALDCLLDLPAGATKAQVLVAMNQHILGDCQHMGIYQRH